MSSYVMKAESRGVGAVAAEDMGLGATPRSCGPGEAYDRIDKVCRPTLASRRAPGLAPSKAVVGRTGTPLRAPLRLRVGRFAQPARGTSTRPATIGRRRVPIVSRPTGTVSGGVMPGSPSDYARPVEVVPAHRATLPGAVAAQNAAADAAAEAAIDEAQIQVPEIKASSKLPLYGMIGAGLITLYLITRKR